LAKFYLLRIFQAEIYTLSALVQNIIWKLKKLTLHVIKRMFWFNYFIQADNWWTLRSENFY